jgi:hypothetical protein
MSNCYSCLENFNNLIEILVAQRDECASKAAELAVTTVNNAREKFLPDCCDESKQDLRDWIECGFKFCPWCGRELRPIT